MNSTNSEHTLVEFEEDESLSVIPLIKFADHKNVNVGESHSIKWKQKSYQAIVLAIGMYVLIYYIDIHC